MTTIRNRVPEIVAELNELADGNYNLGAMREELPSDCATLLVGLTTELNVQLAMARKREAELVAALSDTLSALYQCTSRDSYREFVEANPAIVRLARVPVATCTCRPPPGDSVWPCPVHDAAALALAKVTP